MGQENVDQVVRNHSLVVMEYRNFLKGHALENMKWWQLRAHATFVWEFFWYRYYLLFSSLVVFYVKFLTIVEDEIKR